VLTAEQGAQCKVGSSADSSVTMQMLVAVADSGDKGIILNTIDSVFGCFLVAVAATTNERELRCRCSVGNNMAMPATTQM